MIVDERHALYVGAVLALGMRHGLNLRPVDDELGNYTDRIELVVDEIHPGIYAYPAIRVELVVPPPPADWRLADWAPSGTINLDRKDMG